MKSSTAMYCTLITLRQRAMLPTEDLEWVAKKKELTFVSKNLYSLLLKAGIQISNCNIPVFSNFSATSGAIEMTVNFKTWSLDLINSTTWRWVAPSTFTSFLWNFNMKDN